MEETAVKQFPTVGDGSGLGPSDTFYREELQLAFRNRGMPLEALRYPITPTGMHYLIIHFDIPYVSPTEWRLEVGGMVSRRLSLSLEDIKARPSRTLTVTMECAGNGRALYEPRPVGQPWLLEAIGTSEWTGTPLRPLLEEAGLRDGVVDIVFTGADQGVQGGELQYYQRSLSVEEAMRDELLLAYEMNGEPLQPQHGYPLRLVVPGWYGMTSVKWLTRIDAVPVQFEGYQMMGSYRYAKSQDEEGDPVTLIRPRALMVPPGIPDFLTRTRMVQPGTVTLEGRAWAGRSQVARVEVSTDGGITWSEAEMDAPLSQYAWRGWIYKWDAAPGTHVLCVRGVDTEGNTQPESPEWNYGGFGNNAIQRVEVRVE